MIPYQLNNNLRLADIMFEIENGLLRVNQEAGHFFSIYSPGLSFLLLIYQKSFKFIQKK